MSMIPICDKNESCLSSRFRFATRVVSCRREKVELRVRNVELKILYLSAATPERDESHAKGF